jgi:putative redox protein
MNYERISFDNEAGQRLAARLDLPPGGAPRAFALFAHCFTCTKNLKAVGRICQALNGEGIAVLRFDFTGLGESEGDFTDTNFSSNVSDLHAAAAYLKAHYAPTRILIGHSLGGAAVLQAAAALPEARALATIGAPADPTHVTRLLADERDRIERQGRAEVQLAGRRFTIKRQFLEDLENVRMQQTIRNLRRPLLVFHSPLDEVVGIDNAARIFETARHPKSFISLDRADHLLTDAADARYVGAVISAWACKYIDPVHEASASAATG